MKQANNAFKIVAFVALVILLGMLVSAYDADFGSQAREKKFVLKLNINENKITILDAKIVYGTAQPNAFRSEDFVLKTYSADGGLLNEYITEDPRKLFYEGEPTLIEFRDNADFTMTFPFISKTVRGDFQDYKTGEVLSQLDLGRIVEEFCKNNPKDFDCIGVSPVVAVNEASTHNQVKQEVSGKIGQSGNASIYVTKSSKKVKFLGLIPITMNVNVNVDAQTGRVVSISSPWWSFLTK